MLPAISKVFEIFMYERLFSFFDKKNIFYWKLFAFCSRRCIIDAPAGVTKQIRRGSTDSFTCILVDLRKAFNSILREFFLTKMEKYGVRRNCLNCGLHQIQKNEVSVFE